MEESIEIVTHMREDIPSVFSSMVAGIAQDVQLNIEKLFELQSGSRLIQFFGIQGIVNLAQGFVAAHQMQTAGDEVGNGFGNRVFDNVDE